MILADIKSRTDHGAKGYCYARYTLSDFYFNIRPRYAARANGFVSNLGRDGFSLLGIRTTNHYACSRQIDECDYVILLLGSQYGEQSVAGVSYLSLNMNMR